MKKENWYLVQVKGNSYRLAEQNLKRQGFICFLPTIHTTKRKGNKFRDIAYPLFPGYFFVSFNLERAQWRKINNTIGVARLMGRQGVPQIVPHGFVEALQSQMDNKGHLVPLDLISTGDTVRIDTGPFAGVLGNVERLQSNTRAILLLELMGLKVKVAADTSKVSKAISGS